VCLLFILIIFLKGREQGKHYALYIMFTKIKGDTNQVMAKKKSPGFRKEDYTNHFVVNMSKKSDLGSKSWMLGSN